MARTIKSFLRNLLRMLSFHRLAAGFGRGAAPLAMPEVALGKDRGDLRDDLVESVGMGGLLGIRFSSSRAP